jgi:methylisocitrate lyase
MTDSASHSLMQATREHQPLQVVGVINAFCALLAQQAGHKALYLSGAGVANASRGIPDIGQTTLDDVVTDVHRITAVTKLPLLVDADTGWPEDHGVNKTIQELCRAGAAGAHLEDQVSAKRCGHLEGKSLVSTDEMVDRIKSAVEGRGSNTFVIMARSDAYSVEGLAAAIQRSQEYVEAGADMIFAEALSSLEDYRKFTASLEVPVLANITEFGKTPLFTREELREAGLGLILYPLSAFRAMNAAALNVYETITKSGSQESVVDQMQTRIDLYKTLGYDPTA